MSVVTFVLSKKDSKKIIIDGKEVNVVVARSYCNSSDIDRAYEGQGCNRKKILTRLAIAEKMAQNLQAEYVCYLMSGKLSNKDELTLYPYTQGDSAWCDANGWNKPAKEIKKVSGRNYVTI